VVLHSNSNYTHLILWATIPDNIFLDGQSV